MGVHEQALGTENGQSQPENVEEAPPAYRNEDAGPSTRAEPSGLSVEAPFNFPTEEPLPPQYISSTEPAHKPIAIPQKHPDPAAPFLPAYSPQLLNYGITPESWQGFLDALYAFLVAKVSDRALSHAADIGREVGNVPKRLGKAVASSFKSAGRGISDNAKKGNFFGAAMGVVSGAVALPVSTTLHTVGAAISLPFSTATAIGRRPKTPIERASVYAAAANKKWFGPRGLHAQLVDTNGLGQLIGIPPETALNVFVEAVRGVRDASAAEQITALEKYISKVDIDDDVKLDLGDKTLWLVMTKATPDEGF